MEIPEIGISNVEIGIQSIEINQVNIPEIKGVVSDVSSSIHLAPPVVLEIGSPVVDVPGCVEAHEIDENNKLEEDDPKGTNTFCDGQTPSFDPIQYEPERLVPTGEAPVPKTDTPKKPEPKVPETPEVKPPPVNTAKVDCPSREQELINPIGKVLEGNKKIVSYELIGDKCIEVTEKLSIPQQVITNIPNAGMVTTTASIAIVATTSALMAKPLADILLKVVKPTVKKVIKKIADIRGKKTKVLSVSERINEQRDRNRAIKELRQTLKSKTK